MYCTECGQESRNQASFCTTCGTTLQKPSRESGYSAADRHLGLAAIGLVGGVLALWGLFAPWQVQTFSMLGISQSQGVSPADLLTHATVWEVQVSPTGYAYLAMFGAILAFGGALFCLAIPKNKGVWLVLAAGGILAVLASVLGFSEIQTGSALMGSIKYSYGFGIFLTLLGGLFSLVGFRGLKD